VSAPDPRQHLLEYVSRAVDQAMADHPEPATILLAAPQVLVGLAGSYVLQFYRSGTIGDGEMDQLLASMAATMQHYADPSLNVPTGQEQPRTFGQRLRRLFRG
jgi:hypothetical protein